MMLKDIVKYNEKELAKNKDKKPVSFEFKGNNIYNPFLDEKKENPVSPVNYYGIGNINKLIEKYKKESVKYE